MPANNGSGYSGMQRPADGASALNAQTFLIWSMLSKLHTATIVKVVSCTNSGAVSPVGYVDIQPLVNQVDGNGNAIPHGVIYKCPYMRLQGGSNAVIIDPVAGDIGIALFADRDISKATATKAQASPGSYRMMDMADGLYVGGLLNGSPSQYVAFSASGINIHSPVQVNINGVIFDPSGNVTSPATITAPNVVGTTNVTFGGKSGVAHVHSDPQGGTTGAPV